ncbi:MAG: zf-HC2 domain-containing protein [Acidobacteria bacterium]|nr:zf-HC2 domain-containing protein [Acidobacteriota bacterium]MCG2815250.1 zf-HC2 domain-containing protein [Candidatus Aminicenantes bacterium]
MACKKYRNDMVLYLYEELDKDRRKSLEAHISACEDCRREFSYTKEVFAALDLSRPEKIPEGNWDISWRAIRAGLKDKSSRGRAFAAFPRWSWVAGFLLVFAIGILAGRILIFPPFQKGTQDERERTTIDYALTEHLNSLEPHLLTYANYNAEDSGSAVIEVEVSVLQTLLIQNILLRKALADTHPEATELLEDIDLVLQELINSEPEDSRTPELVKELIYKRDILFKLNILENM